MPRTTKTRGTTIWIGTTTSTAASDTYTEIKGGKSYQGEVGPQSSEIDTTEVVDTYKQSEKGVADAGDLVIAGNYRHDDAGQQALRSAAAPGDDGVYNFKLVQPNGRVRYLKARVFAFRISYGSGNEVMQFKSNLSLTDDPTEVAA